MNIPVGLQLFSVRNELKRDFFSTLEKVAAIGYKYIELVNNNSDMPARELRKHLEDTGLEVVSSHVSTSKEYSWEEAIEYNLELGSPAVVWPFCLFKDKEDVLRIAEKFNNIGELCSVNGIQFYYHNHFQEFQKFDGEFILDILLAGTEPELLKLELDTYWVLRGGVDPIEYMEIIGPRCGLLHQKDLTARAEPVNLFEALDGEVTRDKMFKLLQPESFTEIGSGIMDIKGIIKKATELAYVEYIFIEQDMTEKEELESIELSYKAIQQL